MRLLKLMVVLALAYTMSGNAQKKESTFEAINNSIIKATYYHENGQIAQIGCLKNGKLEGEWVMYADNGKKIALGKYLDGNRTGNWFFWKVDGGALREVTYFEGKLINVVEWNHSNSPTL